MKSSHALTQAKVKTLLESHWKNRYICMQTLQQTYLETKAECDAHPNFDLDSWVVMIARGDFDSNLPDSFYLRLPPRSYTEAQITVWEENFKANKERTRKFV